MRRSLPFLAATSLLLSGCTLHLHYHTGEKHYEAPVVKDVGQAPTPSGEGTDDADKIIEALKSSK